MKGIYGYDKVTVRLLQTYYFAIIRLLQGR